MYLEGASEKAIVAACGFRLSHLYRLIRERCLEVHKDGLVYGWRGLVPNLRIKPYKRKHPVRVSVAGYGAVGAMQTVLDLHPDLRRGLEKRILQSPATGQIGLVKQPRQAHWRWFLDQLRKLGYEMRGEWPFNTQSNGYNAVCRYIDQVLSANPARGARAVGGPSLERKLLTGDGVDRPVMDVFGRVEMDAHKLDGRFCIMLPLPSGDYSAKIVHRIWVIVLVEIVSRAVLGYHLSFRREVSKEDVLRAIKKALSRWYPRQLSFENAYIEGAGFPSSRSSAFLHACWNETSIDGALAEKARNVVETLKGVVGSTLLTPSAGFPSRRSKDDRPYIESFFRTLASRGFQRLSNTTGGKPGDTGGRDPAAVAVNSQFQVEYAEELLDVLIANYNATPHSGLGDRSPLEYLSFIEARGQTVIRHADPNSVQAILSYRKKCRVRGGFKEGRRPYVNFEGARYSNETLAQRHDLVGTDIWVVNHLEDDSRVAEASTLDGMSLGILRAAPPWHRLPHSLSIRRAINSCVRRRMFAIAAGTDAIETFMDFCERQKDRKLPIHPAYLEARRIMVLEAEATIGKSLLEVAIARQSSPPAAPDSSAVQSRLTSGSPHATARRLPARRLAASEK